VKIAWVPAFLSIGFCRAALAVDEPPSDPKWLEKLPAKFVVASLLSSAARKAGVEEGDVVLRVAGAAVTTHEQLWKAISRAPRDGETAVRVLRKGAEIELTSRAKPYMVGVDHLNLLDQYRRVGKTKPGWRSLARGAFEHQLACRWQKAVEGLEKLVGGERGTGLAAPRLLRHSHSSRACTRGPAGRARPRSSSIASTCSPRGPSPRRAGR
jgi:hypothetical protein